VIDGDVVADLANAHIFYKTSNAEAQKTQKECAQKAQKNAGFCFSLIGTLKQFIYLQGESPYPSPTF